MALLFHINCNLMQFDAVDAVALLVKAVDAVGAVALLVRAVDAVGAVALLVNLMQ